MLADFGSFSNYKKGKEPKLIHYPEDSEHILECRKDGAYDYTQVHHPLGEYNKI